MTAAHEHHDHDESHSGHSHGAHNHAREAGEGRLLVALAILGAFTCVEAVGGWWANSIALLAEAGHMLADCVSLGLAVIAIRISRRPPDSKRTYGHRRYQPLAAFVNGLALLALTAWVVYEAAIRLVHQPAVNGRLMLAIAVLGGIANLVAFLALSGARSLNERGPEPTYSVTFLVRGAAAVAAVVIVVSNWTLADPLLSLFVSLLIFRSAWALTRESADVLLESAPPGFDVSRVEGAVVGHVPGLVSVHHVHVWTITGEQPMVTLHANLTPEANRRNALVGIHQRLRETLDVEHCTVQIEEDGPCETPPCKPL